MPFVFIFIGVVMVIAGVRGTSSNLATLVKDDFTGEHNYTTWMLSIIAVGAVGYIPKAQSLSRAFLFLLLLVLVLANRGFFAQFTDALKEITTPAGAA